MTKLIFTYIYKFLKIISYLFGISFSFSSDGEDYALNKILSGIKRGSYIDIGSNHPIKHSNTFSFYLLGWSGVCVDPIPLFNKKYKIFRSGDVFINAGIIGGMENNPTMDFYYYKHFPDNSTFDVSRVEVLKNQFNRHPTSITKIPMITLAELMERFNNNQSHEGEVHLLNLDTEGYEQSILESLFNLNVNPWVICVEDLGYLAETVINSDIHNLLYQKNYILFVRTFLSSIYVRKDVIRSLVSPYIRELKF